MKEIPCKKCEGHYVLRRGANSLVLWLFKISKMQSTNGLLQLRSDFHQIVWGELIRREYRM